MAATGNCGIKCDPEMTFQADYYHPPCQYGQQLVQEPGDDMDLSGFLEMDDKMLSDLASASQSGDGNVWSSLFDEPLDSQDVFDPSTGLPLVNHPPTLPPMGGGAGVGSVDQWVLDETKKLDAQQKIQQQKLLDLQQTLLKTEILKNQLQIHASISHQRQQQQIPSPPPQPSPPATSKAATMLSSAANSGASPGENFNFTPSVGLTGLIAGASSTPKLPISRNVSTSTRKSSYSSQCADSPRENFLGSGGGTSTPPESPPEKKKVHNQIEKKYRSSINDRISLLREMVSKHCKDNKKLQKSVVLQKTIDFIRHLESTIKKLQEENAQLKDMLAKMTGQTRLPNFSRSPPGTPQSSVSPPGSESGEDSGHPPSSPELGESSPQSSSHFPFLPTRFLHTTIPTSTAVPGMLMCVLLVAVFFLNPLYFTGHHPNPIGGHYGSMRTLTSVDLANQMEDESHVIGDESHVIGVFGWGMVWLVRVLVAAMCFGWVTLRSIPALGASSQEGVKFWRFRKQAQQDLQMGEFCNCRDNLESALAVLGRPVPTSSLSMAPVLLWAALSHLMFQLVLGRVGVFLASLVDRRKKEVNGVAAGSKKHGFRVTFSEVAQTYHLLHQIHMTAPGGTHLRGMGLYLSLTALNCAEADRPYRTLSGQVVSEMYFSLSLQSYSIPYLSSLFMWYYLFRSHNQSPSQLPPQLKWTVTPRGKSFLFTGKWEAEVRLGTRLYSGPAALPLYSMSRAFCKELLCTTFNTLLLPPVPSSPSQPTTDASREEFKYILTLATEATSSLISCHGNPRSCDSGFAVIQWWASVGLVACHWSAGEDQEAEKYYPTIEGMLGDSTPVPTALHLAFKALRLHKRPHGSQATPTQVLLQLCSVTSNALQTCVTDVVQDHSDSVENELHQLGLLLACDWLLELRIALWEGDGSSEGVGSEITPGFYQDLDTLAKLVSLLPSALPRLRLYKGCYQLMAGANPMQAQNMLSSTGRASLLRRRGLGKDWKKVSNPGMFSHEQAMAQLLAYKHLPPSLDPTASEATPPGHAPPLERHIQM